MCGEVQVSEATETQAAQSPAAALKEAFWALKEKRIRISPCNSLRASSLGNECERFLFYEQTAWEMRAPHPASAQAIFDLGNQLEDFVLRELEDSGVQVLQKQRDYVDRRYGITGHIDAKLVPPGWTGKPLPAEVKGLNPYTAESIETIDDIRNSRQAWVRKYYAQLQVYLLLDNTELGVFVVLNKVSGQLEFIDCPLDYEFAESLLKRAERVSAAVRLNEPPPRHQTAECQRCPFAHVCNPDIDFGSGVEFFDDAEVLALLKRRDELQAAADEFDAVDKAIKKALPKKPELVAGEYLLVGREVQRKAYQVTAGSYWKWDIRPMKKESAQ